MFLSLIVTREWSLVTGCLSLVRQRSFERRPLLGDYRPETRNQRPEIVCVMIKISLLVIFSEYTAFHNKIPDGLRYSGKKRSNSKTFFDNHHKSIARYIIATAFQVNEFLRELAKLYLAGYCWFPVAGLGQLMLAKKGFNV